jgi:hypothetical protein
MIEVSDESLDNSEGKNNNLTSEAEIEIVIIATSLKFQCDRKINLHQL